VGGLKGLRAALAKTLPGYMIPADFIALKTLPLILASLTVGFTRP